MASQAPAPITEAAAIQHLETSLVEAIKSTSGIDAADAVVAIFVALLGAASAYLFNHLHWTTVSRKEKVAAQLAGISALISSFENVAVSYWVSAQSPASLEAQVLIKARHRAIVKQRGVLAKILSDGKHLPLHRQLSRFSDDVFDVATGGDFESANRQASESTATAIAVFVADIQALLATES